MHRIALRDVLPFGPDAQGLAPLGVVRMPASEETRDA